MQYNTRNPGVRRLMKEAKELIENPSEDFVAAPMEDNLFDWHFTIRGPKDTPFEGGEYHGRIILPPEYPMKPPSIILLTPNGRFQVGEKICLSITNHHPEFWQPAWGIRSVCTALIAFFPTKGNGAIGSLDWSDEDRKVYAKRSLAWTCPNCVSKEKMILPPIGSIEGKPVTPAAGSVPEISFTYEKDKPKEKNESEASEDGASASPESKGKNKETETEIASKAETPAEAQQATQLQPQPQPQSQPQSLPRLQPQPQPQPQPQVRPQVQPQAQAQPAAQARPQQRGRGAAAVQQGANQDSIQKGILDLLIVVIAGVVMYLISKKLDLDFLE